MSTPNTPLLLVILSGFGVYTNEDFYNYTPNLNSFVSSYPATVLKTGEQVNSKIGHRIMGTGRTALPLDKKISSQIDLETFFNKEQVKKLKEKLEQTDKFHLFGSLHGPFKIEHLEACLHLTNKVETKSYLHLIVNKRELDTVSTRQKLRKVKSLCSEYNDEITSILNQESINSSQAWKDLSYSYEVLMKKESELKFKDPIEFSKQQQDFKIAQKQDTNDNNKIGENDVLLFSDYSGEKLIELVKSFSLPVYKFDREYKELDVFTLVEYEKNVPAESIYSRNIFHDNLTEIVERSDLPQFHITETTKHTYLNYYFKGNIFDILSEKQTKIISSPTIDSFDKQPRMSSKEITREFLNSLQKEYQVYIVEFPNFEQMETIPSKKKALTKVDKHLSKLVENVMIKGGSSIITADYKQRLDTEEPHQYVPFVLVSKRFQGLSFPSAKVPNSDLSLAKPTGDLRDVAPTVLKLLELEIPDKMERDGLELGV